MTFDDLITATNRAIRAAVLSGVRPHYLFLGPEEIRVFENPPEEMTLISIGPGDGQRYLLGLQIVEVTGSLGVRAGNLYGG